MEENKETLGKRRGRIKIEAKGSEKVSQEEVKEYWRET